MAIHEVHLANPVFLLEKGRLLYAFDTIVLRRRVESNQVDIESLFDFYSLSVVQAPDSIFPFYLLRLTEESPPSLFGVARGLFESGFFRYASPNMGGLTDEVLTTPNDLYYPRQWNLNNSGYPGVPGADIGMEGAWEFAVGDTGTVIAIIDIAFDVDHVDLGLNKMIAPFDAGGVFFYNRQPDYDPRLPSNGLQYNENFWHGTACLGMARSITDNGAGIASPCRNFFFMPIKAYDDNGWSDEATHASAWAWAIFLDVEAISFSLNYGAHMESVDDLFDEAYQRAIPIFCASGNSGDASKPVVYPANMPQVMAVGATDKWDEVASFSCRGPELDLVAPGDQLFTLDVAGNNGYNRVAFNPCNIDMDYVCDKWGTSLAAPQAAAVAALIQSRHPDLKCDTCTSDAIYEVIRHSAEDQISASDPAGYDTTYGWGRLNAARALAAVCRGDANNDGVVNISDAVYMVKYIFEGGPLPVPVPETGDADGSCALSIGDAVYLINYVYASGPPPPICTCYWTM